MRKILPIISIITAAFFIFILFYAISVQAQEQTEHENPSLQLGEGENEAHIVIQFEPGDNSVREVKFTGDISGLDALILTGMEVITQDFGWGVSVCSIEGVGCPADNCWCGGDYFWNYTQWISGTWVAPAQGASTITITHGAIEGWRWGEWEVGTLPSAPQIVSASNGTEWFARQQSALHGGYPADLIGNMSSSTEALLTIGANNYFASDWSRYTYSIPLLQYVWGNSSFYASKGVSEAGKFAVGLSSANSVCWPPITLTPMDYYSPTMGSYSNETGFHIWGMLGTLALSNTVPIEAVEFLKGRQLADGGWEWNTGFKSDTNTTALAIQTLVATGVPTNSTAILEGLAYLELAQNSDAGFPYDPESQWDTSSDSNSTAYVIQAIYSVGQDPITGTWQIGGSNPVNFLMDQQIENMGFQYKDSNVMDLLSTSQAIPALLGDFLPYKIRSMEVCPTSFLNFIELNKPIIPQG